MYKQTMTRFLHCTEVARQMNVPGVRRDKAALTSGCESHPANAPAGSNRSSYRGDEIAEAFGKRVYTVTARVQ
jgi:hypothetical protein